MIINSCVRGFSWFKLYIFFIKFEKFKSAATANDVTGRGSRERVFKKSCALT